MVERDGKAAAVCVANLKIVAKALLKEEVEFDGKVINKSVTSFLSTPAEILFDLVFIDPPYEITNDEIVSELELLKPLLKEATVVLERSSRTDAPNWPAGYTIEDEKSYGDTVVYWLSA
jgi:16S rRNA (guanine966-N2)-methyltransferase